MLMWHLSGSVAGLAGTFQGISLLTKSRSTNQTPGEAGDTPRTEAPALAGLRTRAAQGTFLSIRSVSHSGKGRLPATSAPHLGVKLSTTEPQAPLATPSTGWADGGAVTSSL